jgi:hypothetical protein
LAAEDSTPSWCKESSEDRAERQIREGIGSRRYRFLACCQAFLAHIRKALLCSPPAPAGETPTVAQDGASSHQIVDQLGVTSPAPNGQAPQGQFDLNRAKAAYAHIWVPKWFIFRSVR